MIELTGRKYAAPWTREDAYIVIAYITRINWRAGIDADKADAEIMLSKMKEKRDAVGTAR